MATAARASGPGAGLIVLLVALLGVAGASAWYAANLRTEHDVLATRLATAERQLMPLVAAARKAFPTEEANVAVQKFGERLDGCVGMASLSAKRSLSADKRQAMVDVLRGETSSDRMVWFEVNLNNPASAAFHDVLSGAFKDAGWQVRTRTTPGIALKPGLFLMVAEETPPAWVDSVQKALDAGGLDVKAARGYRAFYEQQKAERPGWSGVEMAPDQAFAIIIGPDPDAAVAGSGRPGS